MLFLWRMISKIKLNSVELNCSIFFSLYCLIVSKKTDHFLREIGRSESLFWWMSLHLLWCIGMVAVVPTSALGWGFAIWLQQPWCLFVALLLLVDLQEFLYCCDLNPPRIWSFHKIFWPKIENCLDPETGFEFQFHFLKFLKLVVTSNTGPILLFPWIHPFGCEAGSFRGRVCSRQVTNVIV